MEPESNANVEPSKDASQQSSESVKKPTETREPIKETPEIKHEEPDNLPMPLPSESRPKTKAPVPSQSNDNNNDDQTVSKRSKKSDGKILDALFQAKLKTDRPINCKLIRF